MSVPGGPRPLQSLVLFALLGLGVPGCGPASGGDGPTGPGVRPGSGNLVLVAGDTLFDHLGSVAVSVRPGSNLPPPVAERLVPLLRAESWTVSARAWTEKAGRQTAEERVALAVLMGTGEPVRRWEARPPVRLDLGLGVPWLVHRGRETRFLAKGPAADEHGGEDDGERKLLWADRTGRWLFRWDRRDGVLVASGPSAPGEVTYGYRGTAESSVGHAARWLAEDTPPPATAEALACREELGAVDRACLLAPAPTTLDLRAQRILGRRLAVSVAVLDVGFVLEGDQVVRRTGLGDGVTFAVELAIDGGAPRRVWSRHVTSDEGFVAAEVELPGIGEQPVRLRLLTEPGPGGDATADYALWSDLRLRGPRRAPLERPHIVLVDVDTLRADRLGTYGCERPTSPRIDAWAAREAVVYTQVTAVADWTLPSTASILTGLSVEQHGVSDVRGRLGEGTVTIAEALRAAGWVTWANVDGGFVAPAFGFARGFDAYDAQRVPNDQPEQQSWDPDLACLRRSRHGERPVFAFLHTYIVHQPYLDDRRFVDVDYDGPLADLAAQPLLLRSFHDGKTQANETEVRYLDALYDAGVARMDDMVGGFLEQLDDVFEGDPYLVILTADHGEELFEHGRQGHGHSLHGEVLDVPLIVRFPDGEPGRVDRPVSSLDVVPTLLDAAGLPIPERLAGRPLTREPPERRLRIATHETNAWAVMFDGWKLMLSEGQGDELQLGTLYRLTTDPGEKRDVLGSEGERARRLEKLFAQERERFRSAPQAGQEAIVDPALFGDLQALGYLGEDGDGGSASRPRAAPVRLRGRDR